MAKLEDELTQVLDELERATAVPFKPDEAPHVYTELRGSLLRLVTVLNGLGGDHARIGQVLENLLAGADEVVRARQAAS